MDKDSVSRKDIIKAMKLPEGEASKHTFYSAEWILNCINSIPSIATEPKHGKWLERNSGYIKWIRCSVCGYRIYQGTKTNYCPNCGADMGAKSLVDCGTCLGNYCTFSTCPFEDEPLSKDKMQTEANKSEKSCTTCIYSPSSLSCATCKEYSNWWPMVYEHYDR